MMYRLLTLLLLVPLTACSLQMGTMQTEQLVQTPTQTVQPGAATIPPSTPLPTLTPSPTLLPPPTFEPPTRTPQPSLTPTTTLTPTLNLNVVLPGLRGAETPTPSSTPGCEPREDWGLRYTVQPQDALARIAQAYNTSVQELASGNCLSDPNVIVVGQELRVPGGAHPVTPEIVCVPFELLTPMNGAMNVEGSGSLTFNWRGPRAVRNLIRVHKPNGGTYEVVVELRQNETIDLSVIPDAGRYTWYVYPLDRNFVQACPEGGPWTFVKAQAPTPTPTFTALGM